uniref:Uncharacterized protein n=1 Tax=Siphoviridae sp. ctHip2 TaxID=2827830 RepID=A0A8S5RWA5_9CAUD|nr:MAG TPA: hypothetical protein [Siphoviridae sp. ctHip2]
MITPFIIIVIFMTFTFLSVAVKFSQKSKFI